MSAKEIGNLPVRMLYGEQAHLYLWVVNQHIDWGYEVARCWGFEPWNLLTWAKPGLGVGRFHCNTEHILVCRAGSRHGNPFGRTSGTWFQWPRAAHSTKPRESLGLVEACSPDPYVERFARAPRLGWASWGYRSGGGVTVAASADR